MAADEPRTIMRMPRSVVHEARFPESGEPAGQAPDRGGVDPLDRSTQPGPNWPAVLVLAFFVLLPLVLGILLVIHGLTGA